MEEGTAPVDAGAAALAIEPFPGLAVVGEWWRSIERRAAASFFLRWHWIGAMLAESRIAPFVATARVGGRLVGIGLLQPGLRRRHRGLVRARTLFLNETGDPACDNVFIEYNGFLVDRAFGSALEARMAAFVAAGDAARATLPDWDELRLGGVPERYRQFAAATGLAVHVAATSGTARVDLQAVRGSGGTYLGALSANTRQQIRRAVRGFGERGPLAVESAGSVAEADAFLDALAKLHQAYWTRRGRPGAFAHPFMAGMHRRVIASALPEGAVELLHVRAGTRTIGYLYNLIHDGWVGAYCSGFDYPDDAKLKPGYVAYTLCIERHLAAGNRVFDFLAGDDRYKTSLGKAGETLFHLDVQRPRLLLKLEARLRSLRRRMRGPGA
ncbi:MAG: GNAT family N-acetyltransferase [Alphaproteobacteria bacterium]|nr:GNAT family N-acetyltransferase [Alphaproteobacteria bacterium]